jgi:hypothetical protein
MLGEKIGDDAGKITGMRVLSVEGPPRMEVSFETAGRLYGIEMTNMGTYVSTIRPDGTIFGQGQGITKTKDGDAATWVGSGIGKFTGKGKASSFRGAIFYQTQSPRLAHLNSIAALFEHECDEQGNVKDGIWEWK